MKVLVLNCGSSSLKYQLLDMTTERALAEGVCERIGIDNSFIKNKSNGEKNKIEKNLENHSDAVKLVIDVLTDEKMGVIKDVSEIEAIGHRLVHGGEKFTKSVLITDDVIKSTEECVPLAPLHNPANLIGVKACQEIMPNVPMVGVYDTAFHQSMDKKSFLYALPYEYYEKYGVRRYGFHGTSHKYVSNRISEVMNKDLKDLKVISCHIGNGASLCAINKGKVQDTTMGLTPLEGLMMGTRCGDMDPAIVKYVMGKENISIDEMDTILNKKSGFLGVSGISSDMRDVENAASEGNERSKLAIKMFEYKIVKYIGAYAAAMNGVDVIIFTAGIGENGIETRQNVCEAISFLGVDFDSDKNDFRGEEREITKEGSKVKVYVIPTNEELMIAKDTMDIVNNK